MSDITSFYISLAVVCIFIVGGIHLLGYLLQERQGQDLSVSDHTYRLARVITLAKDLFGRDANQVLSWLYSPQPELKGVRPIDKVETPEGAEEVEALLGQIQNGGIN